jgi:hypothetical protein
MLDSDSGRHPPAPEKSELKKKMAGRTSGFGVDIQFGLFEDHEPFFRLSSCAPMTLRNERTS